MGEKGYNEKDMFSCLGYIKKLEAELYLRSQNEDKLRKKLEELGDNRALVKEIGKLKDELEYASIRELDWECRYNELVKVHENYVKEVKDLTEHQKYMIKQKVDNKARYDNKVGRLEVLQLRMSGLSFTKIAEMMNSSESTVRRRYAEAVKLKDEAQRKVDMMMEELECSSENEVREEGDIEKAIGFKEVTTKYVEEVMLEFSLGDIRNKYDKCNGLVEDSTRGLMYIGSTEDWNRLRDKVNKIKCYLIKVEYEMRSKDMNKLVMIDYNLGKTVKNLENLLEEINQYQ